MNIQRLATLRCIVGKLGEKESAAWWPSEFFSASSEGFINPLFPRTGLVARCHGVTSAAAQVHDERIGVGKVFHLFRLPEELEMGIHEALHDAQLVGGLATILDSVENANSALAQESSLTESPSEGPVVVGGVEDVSDEKYWQLVAGLYVKGIEANKAVFPYFADTQG